MEDKIESTVGSTGMGLTKYVHFMYFGGAVVLGWLFMRVIEEVWTALNLEIAAVPPPMTPVIIGATVLVAAGLGFYMWKNDKVNKLALEIVTELSKVSWPTRKELYSSTIVVIVLSIVASIILGLFDAFWSWFTDSIFGIRA